MSGSNAMMSNKKQREVYVGNLTIGVVNDVMLRDLFNGALSHLVADPHVNPPVVSTSMDPSGEAPRWSLSRCRTCSAQNLAASLTSNSQGSCPCSCMHSSSL